jgi:hypothetical protein
MSAVWPAAARASTASVTQKSGSWPGAGVICPSSRCATSIRANCSHRRGKSWLIRRRLAMTSRTSSGPAKTVPSEVSSFSARMAPAASAAISRAATALASSPPATGLPRASAAASASSAEP